MPIPKKSKKLAALANRSATNSGARDVPNIGGANYSAVDAYKRLMGEKFGVNTQSLASDEGVIPLPDEDELERVRRRRAARRGGGRASTVLSDDNRLGG